MDDVAGLYRDKTPNMMEELQQLYKARGMSDSDWNINIDALTKYMMYQPSVVMQTAVTAGLSHWDWYVGKIGGFIEFARKYGPAPEMSQNRKDNLTKIPLCPFPEQIRILEEASDKSLNVSKSQLDLVGEMVLARNLGIHNQWEVTSYYIQNTHTTGWSLGDIREVTPKEVEAWRDALYEIIKRTTDHFAKMYSKVPDFDPYATPKAQNTAT